MKLWSGVEIGKYYYFFIANHYELQKLYCEKNNRKYIGNELRTFFNTSDWLPNDNNTKRKHTFQGIFQQVDTFIDEAAKEALKNQESPKWNPEWWSNDLVQEKKKAYRKSLPVPQNWLHNMYRMLKHGLHYISLCETASVTITMWTMYSGTVTQRIEIQFEDFEEHCGCEAGRSSIDNLCVSYKIIEYRIQLTALHNELKQYM